MISCVTIAEKMKKEDATSFISVRELMVLTVDRDGTISSRRKPMRMPMLKDNLCMNMRVACDIDSPALLTRMATVVTLLSLCRIDHLGSKAAAGQIFLHVCCIGHNGTFQSYPEDVLRQRLRVCQEAFSPTGQTRDRGKRSLLNSTW